MRGKKDLNQDAIIATLEGLGCTVVSIHMLPGRCDLLVHHPGFGRCVKLVEVKSGEAKSANDISDLTDAEEHFGLLMPVYILRNDKDCAALVEGSLLPWREGVG
jgi:hypothetical protein